MDEDALWICQAAKNARGQTLVRIHLRGIERLIALIKRTGLTAQRKAQC
jgi:hypothetical protein